MTFHRLRVVDVTKLYFMGFSECHPQNTLDVPEHERMSLEEERKAAFFQLNPLCQLFFFSSASCCITICWQNLKTLFWDFSLDPKEISQLCALVGKPPIAFHPCLTCVFYAAGMYCRHKQCHLPEEQSTSNSVFSLTYLTPVRTSSPLFKTKQN